MKTTLLWGGLLVVASLCGSAGAQEPFGGINSSPLARRLLSQAAPDLPALKTMLTELGHEVGSVSAGQANALQIELKTGTGVRKHLIFIDERAQTMGVISGGFTAAPDVSQAPAAWLNKVLKFNHRSAPRTIFINDHGVIGLTTVRGLVATTAEELKTMLAEHVRVFDDEVAPLAAELPPTR